MPCSQITCLEMICIVKIGAVHTLRIGDRRLTISISNFAELISKVVATCIGGTPHRKGVNVEIDCIAMLD